MSKTFTSLTPPGGTTYIVRDPQAVHSATIGTSSDIGTVGTPSVEVTVNSTNQAVFKFHKLKGVAGDAGKWYTGTDLTGESTNISGPSGTTVYSVGAMYLNTSTNNVYICTTGGTGSASKWAYTTCIRGDQGAGITYDYDMNNKTLILNI